VSAGGVKAAGGLTVDDAGIVVAAGGATVSAGGVKVAGGLTIDDTGLSVTSGAVITNSISSLASLNMNVATGNYLSFSVAGLEAVRTYSFFVCFVSCCYVISLRMYFRLVFNQMEILGLARQHLE
jgi:hypothetical protein